MRDPAHPDPPVWSDDEDPFYWWACREPERPSDNHVIYSELCEFCMGKLRIDAALNPEVKERLVEHGREEPDGHVCAVPPDLMVP